MTGTLRPNGSALALLRSLYSTMTSTDQKIATAVFDDPDAILRSPVSQIATRADTSPAAISRFTAKLGYKGLSDFKIALALDVASGGTTAPTEPISSGDTGAQILSKTVRENRRIIRDTLEIMPADTLDSAIRALGKARRIVVIGVGQMGHLAMDTASKLTQAGRDATASRDYVEQLVVSRSVGGGDVLLCISYEGAIPPLLYSAEIASRAGATVVGICRAGESPLSELLDIHLPVSAGDSAWRTASTSAHVAIVTIVDALVTGILAADPDALRAWRDTDALIGSEQLE